ncbi:YchJ family protein [Hydrogenimonas sp.]
MLRECPCGSGEEYMQCCGRYIEGGARVPTAVALMRSRYTAYVLKNTDYIVATAVKKVDSAIIENAMREGDFYRLEIISCKRGGAMDKKGEVTFKAYYRTTEGEGVLHERSLFVNRRGKWLYDEEASIMENFKARE